MTQEDGCLGTTARKKSEHSKKIPMSYNFTLVEKGTSKGCFIRVCDKKLIVSKDAKNKISSNFDLYTDKENNAILVKKSENGRVITVGRKTNTVTITGIHGMPLGRYFYVSEYDGGFLFLKK